MEILEIRKDAALAAAGGRVRSALRVLTCGVSHSHHGLGVHEELQALGEEGHGVLLLAEEEHDL